MELLDFGWQIGLPAEWAKRRVRRVQAARRKDKAMFRNSERGTGGSGTHSLQKM